MVKTKKKPITKRVRAKKRSDNGDWLFDLTVSSQEQNVSIDERQTKFAIAITTTDAFGENDQAMGVELYPSGKSLGDHTSIELWVANNPDVKYVVKKVGEKPPLQLGSFKKSTTVVVNGIIRTGHFHYAFVADNEAMRVSEKAPSETPSDDLAELESYGLKLDIHYAGLQTIQVPKNGAESQVIEIVVQED